MYELADQIVIHTGKTSMTQAEWIAGAKALGYDSNTTNDLLAWLDDVH